MKLGADGSLHRITSSVDSNNIIILASSESQNSLIPAYGLFIIGEDKNQYETASEKSEDEIDDKIVKDTNLNIENDTKNDSDVSRKSNINMDRKNKSSQRFRNRNRSQPNNWRSKERRRKRNHKSRAGRRNYNNSSSTFQQSTNTEISPWLPRNEMRQTISFNQYPDYPTFSQPTGMISANPPNPNDSIVAVKFGLLGDSPLSHPVASQFHRANTAVIPEPMYWSNKLGAEPNAVVPGRSYWNDSIPEQNIVTGENFWNDEHDNSYYADGPSNSYQRPVPPDRKHPMKATRGKLFHYYDYQNKRGNNNGRDRWQGNHRNDQEGRQNDHYVYNY